MPSANVSDAAEQLFLAVRDCALDSFRHEIKADSIPLKHNISDIEPLDPTKIRRKSKTGREQVALIASCLCNRVDLAPGSIVPRRLTINRETNFIEKGASQDIIASSAAGWIPALDPLNDSFVLSRDVCDAIQNNFQLDRIAALRESLSLQGST